jgi:hypothetical protein
LIVLFVGNAEFGVQVSTVLLALHERVTGCRKEGLLGWRDESENVAKVTVGLVFIVLLKVKTTDAVVGTPVAISAGIVEMMAGCPSASARLASQQARVSNRANRSFVSILTADFDVPPPSVGIASQSKSGVEKNPFAGMLHFLLLR